MQCQSAVGRKLRVCRGSSLSGWSLKLRVVKPKCAMLLSDVYQLLGGVYGFEELSNAADKHYR